MEQIKGKYAEATAFADDLEQYARAQLTMICDNEAAEGSVIRVMPDAHPGKVGPIGLTMTFTDRILPMLLGIDIGCGVTLVETDAKRLDFQKLDRIIREKIPSGHAIRKTPPVNADEFPFEELCCVAHIDIDRAKRGMGTLGGGNHFIEADRDDEGNYYLAIHSGSRHLGKEITDYYMREGARELDRLGKEVPYEWTYLTGDLMEHYVSDVAVATRYAKWSRNVMLAEIMKGMKLKAKQTVVIPHNYVEQTDNIRILRKGAISAKQGEPVVIPLNMRDGILIGTGKGNTDWNESAPHGAGRVLRRDEVKNHHTVNEFRKEMEGIYCTCIGAGTLDEAPFAYRDAKTLEKALQETVTVKKVLRPVYCCKAAKGSD